MECALSNATIEPEKATRRSKSRVDDALLSSFSSFFVLLPWPPPVEERAIGYRLLGLRLLEKNGWADVADVTLASAVEETFRTTLENEIRYWQDY